MSIQHPWNMEVDHPAFHLRCELLGHHEDVSWAVMGFKRTYANSQIRFPELPTALSITCTITLVLAVAIALKPSHRPWPRAHCTTVIALKTSRLAYAWIVQSLLGTCIVMCSKSGPALPLC